MDWIEVEYLMNGSNFILSQNFCSIRNCPFRLKDFYWFYISLISWTQDFYIEMFLSIESTKYAYTAISLERSSLFRNPFSIPNGNKWLIENEIICKKLSYPIVPMLLTVFAEVRMRKSALSPDSKSRYVNNINAKCQKAVFSMSNANSTLISPPTPFASYSNDILLSGTALQEFYRYTNFIVICGAIFGRPEFAAILYKTLRNDSRNRKHVLHGN